MAQYYGWFVFAHIVGVVVFAVAHGVSIFAAFRIRGERDIRIVASHLRSSQIATGVMYLGLLLLGLGGLGAAAVADLWSQPYIAWSGVVLVVVLVVMYAVASPYYVGIRKAIAPDPATGEPSITPDALATLLHSRRPDILMTVGSIGLILMLWLMVLKPS